MVSRSSVSQNFLTLIAQDIYFETVNGNDDPWEEKSVTCIDASIRFLRAVELLYTLVKDILWIFSFYYKFMTWKDRH